MTEAAVTSSTPLRGGGLGERQLLPLEVWKAGGSGPNSGMHPDHVQPEGKSDQQNKNVIRSSIYAIQTEPPLACSLLSFCLLEVPSGWPLWTPEALLYWSVHRYLLGLGKSPPRP